MPQRVEWLWTGRAHNRTTFITTNRDPSVGWSSSNPVGGRWCTAVLCYILCNLFYIVKWLCLTVIKRNCLKPLCQTLMSLMVRTWWTNTWALSHGLPVLAPLHIASDLSESQRAHLSLQTLRTQHLEWVSRLIRRLRAKEAMGGDAKGCLHQLWADGAFCETVTA